MAAAPRTERKVVTVLFCDLAGFTSRSDEADPEDVRAMLLPFHALAKVQIERFGGTLDKFIGDAAMGVFGWPAVHEDDPERAVQAALGIAEGVARMNEEHPEDPLYPLTVRVGVNTGEAAVTLATGVQLGENVAGDVVNTASRLQTAAPLGSAIVGETTHQATKDAFEYEAMDPISVKGKAQPVAIWRVIAARAPTGVTRGRDYSTPFVGREDERRLLGEKFRQAVEAPSTQLVTVVAEPGAGKSRLIAQFRADLEARGDPIAWHRGRNLSYGDGITFWALGEIVKSHAGILESDGPDDRWTKLEAGLADMLSESSERAWLQARLAPLVGIESALTVDRDEAFAAWARFLDALAQRGPMAVVIEDIHWADPAMLAFMEYLCGRKTASPMLVIATARPELYDRDPEWGTAAANSTIIKLSPLTPDETATIIGSLLEATVLPPQTQALLLERAGGNPLYTEEFVRMLTDRGLIDRRGRLASDLRAVTFPDNVQALIAARLDTLPPERKDVIHDAAVIGRVFWSGALAFLGDRDHGAVESELGELSKKELVRPAPASSIQEEVEYAFWHALIRDVGYGQIPRADRSAKHRLAAQWTEAMAGDRIADHAEILAHHATSAIDLARAARVTEGLEEIVDAARRYLRLAGIRAMALDVAKAEEHFRRALDLTPPEHPDRPRIEAGLAEVAFQGGRFEEAEGLYLRAVDGLREQRATAEAADAMVRLSVVTEYRGDPARSRDILGEAIEMLSAMPPGPQLARALTEAAGSLLATGRNVELIQRADRAIELAASAGEVEAEMRAHGFRGYARVVLGDLGGLEEQRAAIETGHRLGFARSTAIGYSNLGSCLILAEGPRAAMKIFRQGLAFAEVRGLREMAEFFRNLMLDPLIELGEWDEAIRLASAVAEDARRRGAVYEEVFAESDRASVLSRRDAPGAGEEAERVLSRAREIGDAPLLFLALLTAGRTSVAAGDLAGARAAAQETFDITQGDQASVRAADLVHPVELAVRAGSVDLAEKMLEGMNAYPLQKNQHGLTHARATVAEASGRYEEALALYDDAAVRWGAFGLPYERGLALLGAARCLAELGLSSEAPPRLAEAGEIFAGLGADRLVAEAEAGTG
jgi:class 3 adenylate cyclase/tetratricopeptide (TPR) repeat protein